MIDLNSSKLLQPEAREADVETRKAKRLTDLKRISGQSLLFQDPEPPAGKVLRSRLDLDLQKSSLSEREDKAGKTLKSMNLTNLLPDYRAFESEHFLLTIPRETAHEDRLIPFALSLVEYAATRTLTLVTAEHSSQTPFLCFYAQPKNFSSLLDEVTKSRNLFHYPSGPATREYSKKIFFYQENVQMVAYFTDLYVRDNPMLFASSLANCAALGTIESQLGRQIPWLSQGFGTWLALDAVGSNQLTRIGFSGMKTTAAPKEKEERLLLTFYQDSSLQNHRKILCEIAKANLAEGKKPGSGGPLARRIYVTLKREFSQTDEVDYFVSLGLTDYLLTERRPSWNRLCTEWKKGEDWRIGWVRILGTKEQQNRIEEVVTQQKTLRSDQFDRQTDEVFQATTELLEKPFWNWILSKYTQAVEPNRLPPFQPALELLPKSR